MYTLIILTIDAALSVIGLRNRTSRAIFPISTLTIDYVYLYVYVFVYYVVVHSVMLTLSSTYVIVLWK